MAGRKGLGDKSCLVKRAGGSEHKGNAGSIGRRKALSVRPGEGSDQALSIKLASRRAGTEEKAEW